MKFILAFLLLSVGSIGHAAPISYVFGGHITHVSDVTDIPEIPPGYVKDDLPQLKDWLRVGDRYRGRMTFDTNTIAYGASCDFGATICGGLTFFEMSLGERTVSLNFPASSTVPNIQLSSATSTDFISWLQVLGTFDSFRFEQGSISGVDSAYFEGFAGEAKYYARVPEPSSITLLFTALFLVMLRKVKWT